MALIAAQMYTLRELTKTPAEIAVACAKVKKMGYDGIQSSGMGPIDPNELKKILDGEGLECAATHIPIERMETELDKVVEEHNIIGCKYMAIGGFFPGTDPEIWKKDLWLKFIDRFNAIAEKLKGTGIVLGYHNHSHEFAPLTDGPRPIDLLLARLDPSIFMEFDTYWVADGGADPIDYIKRVAGRIPCVHFKDMTKQPDRTSLMCEIGDGNLNWPGIIEACRYSAVKWYIVERDSGVMEPFASLERSIKNMRENMGL